MTLCHAFVKRATVYFDEDLHKALKLRAFEADRSISDLVNDAVRDSLEEDRLDLEVVRTRSSEKTVSYETFQRDLNRRPAEVLSAVRKFGSVEVRTRRGEVFTVTAKPVSPSTRSPDDIASRFAALWLKQRDLGHIAAQPSENERINRIIAGDE